MADFDKMSLEALVRPEGHDCECGKHHVCELKYLKVGRGVVKHVPDMIAALGKKKPYVVCDKNTYAVAGEKVCQILTDAGIPHTCYIIPGERISPAEWEIGSVIMHYDPSCDMLLGVGSGVVNDTCKVLAHAIGVPSAIVGTAPSMDGYASSGAAMIMDGMKVTYTTHPPKIIVADVDVVKNAPMDMIRAGYGDIVGKYSSLNDWKLSHLINDEYFCQEIYDLVLDVTNNIRDSVAGIVAREDAAIEYLTKALVLIGVTLSLLGSTRPGSGSEHHLSHFFEIVGLVRDEPYFIHGTDVAYSTIVTAGMRERVRALASPGFCQESEEDRLAAWQRIYGRIYGEVKGLQESAGSYRRNLQPTYVEKWKEIVEILNECPTAEACRGMFRAAGYRLEAFEEMYGAQKIHDAMLYGKDLKDRYSVLWLYYALFSGREDA